jgi:hypothetical protein
MHSFLDRVCDQLNLQWAWEKVKRASMPGDVWIDEVALASFEINLGTELVQLASDLRHGRYRIVPIYPMAFPKNPDTCGNSRVRQYFHFAIRDQVAWTAVVNIVGPYVDSDMPAWSYGNRLYRSTWIEEERGVRRRYVGPYRHSSGRIYRPFQQAWPIFRRHIALAISAATSTQTTPPNLDLDDLDELNLQLSADESTRCPYVNGEYWSGIPNANGTREIYWASVDLEKFYPSISLQSCVESIVSCIPESHREEAEQVLKMLTHLPLNLEGWSNADLRHIELTEDRKQFRRIPTGLMVSGFLANAALLKVDQEVVKHLPRGRVAHFRYVDDHVILAPSFDDLVTWLAQYQRILKRHGMGAHINPEKTEPELLGQLLIAQDDPGKSDQSNSDLWQKAKSACKLDPEFPSPLMTKTIALVSAIGRTDFTALEEDELGILSQQLEHLLLVDLPESEMPERTRLAFAATRLARVAEARLASPETLVNLSSSRRPSHNDEILQGDLSETSQLDPVAALSGLTSFDQLRQLAGIANRVFNLVRHVLRVRPDRVRLWTHALGIARRLGSTGLQDLFADIDRYSEDPINCLAASYVMGNSYAVLAAETVKASQILSDNNAAGWRRAASLRFLRDVAELTRKRKQPIANPWFVAHSYRQFCVGVYCGNLVLNNNHLSTRHLGLNFDESVLNRGFQFLADKELSPQGRVALAWWGSKFELRTPVRRAPPLASQLGALVQDLPESDQFWQFFPADAPTTVLRRIATLRKEEQPAIAQEGWWFDALHERAGVNELQEYLSESNAASRAQRILLPTDSSNTSPLPLWAAAIWQRSTVIGDEDWRLGEWTCLEIVRQAAELLATENSFDQGYVSKSAHGIGASTLSCAHPLNFMLPTSLITTATTSWQDWKQKLRLDANGVVRLSPQQLRLHDYRYSPMVSSPLGTSQNAIRGLGLVLFGLLSRSFMLPVQWNGYGHESLLKYLPQLLRNELTYSSATLGILEACLQPRATENLLAGLFDAWIGIFDEDTGNDPVRLIEIRQLIEAIEVAQAELERNQIATLGHRYRQLTPVNLMHLTDSDWQSYFQGDEQ